MIMGKISIDQYKIDRTARQSQPRELKRVKDKLHDLVIDFVKALHTGQVFHMAQLEQHIQERRPDVAPGSAGRILRLLRDEGLVEYDVVNRRRSAYVLRRHDLA